MELKFYNEVITINSTSVDFYIKLWDYQCNHTFLIYVCQLLIRAISAQLLGCRLERWCKKRREIP